MARVVPFFLAFLFILQGPALSGEKLSNVLDGIRKSYSDIPGLTMSYSREIITKSMSMLGEKSRGDTASGKIYFKPPDSMRLDQEKPEPETIVTNGRIMWWYIPKKKLVYRYGAEEFGKELKLLSDIFSGLREIEDRFSAELVSNETWENHVILLRPDPAWQDIDHLILTATPEHLITSVEIHNKLGGVTHFRLDDRRVTGSFDDDLFQFAAPEGVKVLEQSTQ